MNEVVLLYPGISHRSGNGRRILDGWGRMHVGLRKNVELAYLRGSQISSAVCEFDREWLGMRFNGFTRLLRASPTSAK